MTERKVRHLHAVEKVRFAVVVPNTPDGWARLREIIDALRAAKTDEEISIVLPLWLPHLYKMLSPSCQLFELVDEQMWGDVRKELAFIDATLRGWGA